MDLRGDFNERQVNELINLLKKKTVMDNGHHIFKVMKSRAFRLSAELVYRTKFYPVWAILERLGKIKDIRPGGDVLLAPTCNHKHCVNPEHMKWVQRSDYRARFQKSKFEHSCTVWNEDKLVVLQKLVAEKKSQSEISKILGVGQSTVSRACKELSL